MARWLKLTAASNGEEVWLNLDNAIVLAPGKGGKGTKVSFSTAKDAAPVEIKESITEIQEVARQAAGPAQRPARPS